MIDVCMGEHDGAEVFDRQGKLPIFLGGFLSLALKHPAVQRYGVAVHVKQMTRTGYFTRSTNERYLQRSTFCYRITLKENRQTLLVLRHERRLPAATAPLVEEICESIFVLTGVTCELDYHGLVFFHQGLEIMSR